MSDLDRLYQKYGDPLADISAFKKGNITIWDIPIYINTFIPALPNHLMCHHDFVEPLQAVLYSLIEVGLYKEIKTFDGCYVPRLQRNSAKCSIHSFGTAIDLNAHENPFGWSYQKCVEMGLKPFSKQFVDVWRNHHFSCGADFKPGREDGMHFQIVPQ